MPSPTTHRTPIQALLSGLCLLGGLICLGGCRSTHGPAADQRIQAVRLDGSALTSIPQAARNQSAGLVMRIDAPPPGRDGHAPLLRIGPLRSANSPDLAIPIAPGDVYQLAWMPVDLNHAAVARHRGPAAVVTQLPRALLPVTWRDQRTIDLTRPTGQAPVQPTLLWFDVHVPASAPPGRYAARCEILTGSGRGKAIAAGEISLDVNDPVLPEKRQALMVATLDRADLARLYPRAFEALRVPLLARDDPATASAVRLLDELVGLGQRHRSAMVAPWLQPVVKWPSGRPPTLDWSLLDPILAPWMDGSAFPDGAPLGFWPLPRPDQLGSYDPASQEQYWQQARAHAAERGWLDRMPAALTPADAAGPQALEVVKRGGGETDVLYCGWLAFLKRGDGVDAPRVSWGPASPQTSSPTEPAGPDDAPWFYPGEWFGVDSPVPSVQTMWARSAQQDYELLRLAEQCGQLATARTLAQALTQPIASAPGTSADAVQELLSGTPDPGAWDQARDLLIRATSLAAAGSNADPSARAALDVELSHFIAPRQRPLLVVRQTEWTTSTADPARAVHLRLLTDVYNGSGVAPIGGELGWSRVPPAWTARPQPIEVPPIDPFGIGQTALDADVDITRVGPPGGAALELTFTDSLRRSDQALGLVIPVAICHRRRPGLVIDGALDEWDETDALHSGPLVEMLSRPGIRAQQLSLTPLATRLHAAWSDENLYVAFELQGPSPATGTNTRNFVEYEDGRAWGEDLAEVIVQALPSGDAAKAGAVLHVVLKPSGHWVERKAGEDASWQPAEAPGLRYAAAWPDGVWRGEIAIPWASITGAGQPWPRALRFNFARHTHADGRSASWAGPVDSGRDERFTGLLLIADAPRAGEN
jgi:hypothetical protein